VARITRAQLLEYLGVVPMFNGLSKKDLATVARVTDQVRVPAETVIAEQGEAGDAFYLIVSGSAVVRRNGRKLGEIGPGDFFGEVALLDGGPRSATVKMLEESVLLVMHRKDFEPLIAVPSIARKLLVGLAERLRAADTRLLA
jgi:CRP-like cAMP-binding protein